MKTIFDSIPGEISVIRLFADSITPNDALSALRKKNDPPHTETGMAELIAPDGESNGFFTTWYCRLWCSQHEGWSFKEL